MEENDVIDLSRAIKFNALILILYFQSRFLKCSV